MQVENQRIAHLQLIEENKSFMKPSIQAIVSRLGGKGKHYYNIGIIGVQNSGKSTLLNYLFGTKFEVLQAVMGQKTTKGTWVCLDKQKDIIVMDVQGNDSQVNVDHMEFQKMVSTFALMNAHILLINFSQDNMGRNSGSQQQTLNAVLEICLETFKQQSPKTLLFCVRDSNLQQQSMNFIRNGLKSDVNAIWEKIKKPQHLKQFLKQPQRFFKVQVVFLPKFKPKQPQKFIEYVNKLRKRFVDSTAQDYLFKDKDFKYNTVAEDLPQLYEKQWELIKNNKKINLPSEKIQLAKFRCSQISQSIKHKLKEALAALQTTPTDFKHLLNNHLQMYDLATQYYGKQAEKQKQALQKSLKDDIIKQISSIIQKKNKQIQGQISNLNTYINQNSLQSLSQQLKKFKQSKINQFTELLNSMNYQIFDRVRRIEEITKKINQKQLIIISNKYKLVYNEFQSQCSRQIIKLCSKQINQNFNYQFWNLSKPKILQLAKQLINKLENKYKWIYNHQFSQQQKYKLQSQIQNGFVIEVTKALKDKLENKCQEYFKQKMKKDDQGHLRNFNLIEQKQIQQIFEKNREQIFKLVESFDKYKNQNVNRSSMIDEDMYQNTQLVFDSKWLAQLNYKLDQHMIINFNQIIREKKQAELRKVPWWLFAIILYFVYDDLWFQQQNYPITHYALTSVLVFILIIFAIGKGNILYDFVQAVGEKLPYAR